MLRLYFDTSYLVRLYLDDLGSEKVRLLATEAVLSCSLHGRTEIIAALHRAARERRFSRRTYLSSIDQFRIDEEEQGCFDWIEPDVACYQRAEAAFRAAGLQTFLIAADAMHLACAAENGFREIYSNNRHLLAAAPLFGLTGRNVIG